MEVNTKDSVVKVHIRWLIRRDMPEVFDIERNSFEFPWFEEEFIRCLRQRNCIGMVAELGERVVAFMIYELHPKRLHLLNFAVDPDMRRRGVGRQMVEKLIGKMSHHRRTRLSLEIRETNLQAQQFFRAMGFKCTDAIPGFYDDSDEEAYLFQWVLPRSDDGFAPENRLQWKEPT